MTPRERLMAAYRAALIAVDGREAVRRALARTPVTGPVRVVAVGKAAGPMAAGALEALGDGVVAGIVVHPDGAAAPADPRLRVMASAHPVPDARSLQAGEALERFVVEAPDDARFLFLLSGGASSLVEALAEGGTLEGLAALNRRLLADGLPIQRMNRVRRAVSRIKGGRLGARLRGRPARALLISDVRGDDPSVIGSGLLFSPTEGASEPSDIPQAYAGLLPPAPPGPGIDDPSLAGVDETVIAGNDTALAAAAESLRDGGIPAAISTTFLDGDAVTEGERVAAAVAVRQPGALLWGGEPTVLLPDNPGQGGRMQALALSAARALDGRPDVTLLAAGTDGIDGHSQAAGAVIDGATVARGRAHGLSADASLAAADSGTFLDAAGDLVITGPTGTNVMDVVIGLRHPASPGDS